MQDNQHRKKLYGYLQGKGIYDNEDQFNADMDNEESRHALFLRMQQGGYKSSWEDFNNNLKPELESRADKETKDAEAIAAAGAGTGVDKSDVTGGAGVSRNAAKGQAQQAGMRSQQVRTAQNQGGAEAGVQRQGNNNGKGGADLGSGAGQAGGEAPGTGAAGSQPAIENHNEGAPLVAPSPVDSSKLVDARDMNIGLSDGPIDPERNIEEEKQINSFFSETMVPRIDEFIGYGQARSDKANKSYGSKIDWSRGLMGNQYASYGDAGKEIDVLAKDAWYTDPQKVEDNVMKIFGLMPVDSPVRDGKLHKNGKEYRVVNGFVVDTPEQKALGDLVTKMCGFDGKEPGPGEKVKPLTEEEIEAMNTLYATKMNKVVNMLQNNMYKYLQEKGMPANALEYIAKSAWKGSLFGQVTSILVDRAMQDKGFRLKVREDLNGATLKDMIEAGSNEQFMNQYGHFGQLAIEGAAGAGSMIIDSPVFGAAGFGAEGAGMWIGNLVGRKLGTAAGSTAARMVMSAMPFGGYEAIAEGVGQAKTGEFAPLDILKAYGSGSLKGAGLGLTSKFIEGAGEKAYKWAFDRFGQNAGQVARTATKIGGFVGEVGTFTAYEIVPEMWDENGNWKGTTMEEIGNALGRQGVMIGLLKAWSAPGQIKDRIGSAENFRKAFGQEGVDELKSAGIDIMKMLGGDKLSQEQIDNPNYEGKDASKVLQNKNNQDRAELVRQVMANPNISWNTKASTMYIMTGMKLEPGKVARVEVSKDGKVALLKDANGNLLRRRYLDKNNREKVLHGAIHQMHMENIDELESAIGNKIADIPGAIQAVAAEEHMSYERIEEAMAASAQGKAERWQEKIAQKVQAKAEENVASDNIYELAKIRAEIEAEYGVDLNGSIYNLNPSEAQMRATQAYSERLDALAGDITGKNEKIKARMEAKRQAQAEVEAEADRLRPNVRQDGRVVSCKVRGREGDFYRLDDDPAQPEFARVRQDGGQVEYVNKELVTDEKVTDYERYMAGYADAKTGAVDRQMDNQERGLHPNTPGQFRQGMQITITGADGKTKKVVVMAAEGDKVVIQDAESVGKEGAEQTEMDAKVLQQMDSDYKYAYDEANRRTSMTGQQYTAEDMLREKSQQEQKLQQDRQKWGQEVVDYGQKMGTKVTALHNAEEARAAIEEAVASGAISKQKGDELLYKLLDRGEMHGVISEEEYNKKMSVYTEAYNKRMIDKETYNRLVNDLNVLRGKHYWMINKGSKGWFLTKTGEVFVYLPNATTAADAKSTILHEVVAHKGMRNLLAESGDEGAFNDAMLELANMLPEKDRQEVARLAKEKYNNRIAVAMDEYIAKIAEDGKEPGWIGRAYGYMRDLARQRFGLELNNDDIRYMLWRANEGLKGNEEGRVKDNEQLTIDNEQSASGEEGPQPEEQGTPVESMEDVNTIVVGGGEHATEGQVESVMTAAEMGSQPVETAQQEQGGADLGTEAGQAGGEAPGTEAAGETAGPQEGDQFKQATREDLTDNTQLRVIKEDGSASIIMIKEIGENGVAQVDIYADGDMTKEPVRTTMHVNELGRMVDSQQVIAHHNESAGVGTPGEGQAAEGADAPAETGQTGGEAPGTEAAGSEQGGADLGTEAGGAVSEAVKKIPVDKDGKLLYEQAPIEDTYQAIYEQYGGDFHQVIQDAVEMAQAAYDKAKKGGDIDVAAQAYRKLKYWQGVANTHRIRREAHFKEFFKQKVAKNVDGVVNEMLEAGNNYDEIEKRIEDAIEGMRGNEDMYNATREYWNDISDKVRDEANAQYWSNKLAEGDDVKERLDAMTKEEGEKMLQDLGADQMMWLKSSGSWSGFKQSNVYKRACERNDADLKSIMEEVAEENYQKYLEWKEIEERKKGGARMRDGEYEAGAARGDVDLCDAIFKAYVDEKWKDTMVRDKNGVPLVVYHGTHTGGFTRFSGGCIYGAREKRLASNYLYDDQQIADYEADGYTANNQMYELYMNIKNPIDLGNHELRLSSDHAKDIFDKLGVSLEEVCKNTNLSDSAVIWELAYEPWWVNLLKSKGYDGIKALEGTGERLYGELKDPESADVEVWAAFDPSQVKSADPITYDDNGKVIPLRERLSDSGDIREREGEYEAGVREGNKELTDEILDEVAKMKGYGKKVWRVNSPYNKDKGYTFNRDSWKGDASYTAGVYFADDLGYYDNSDTHYEKKDAEPYYFDDNIELWDPIQEFGLYADSWSDIYGDHELFKEIGLVDEMEGGGKEAVTSTDGLAGWAYDHGYDGVILRDIPQSDGKKHTEYAIFDSSKVKKGGVTYDDQGKPIPLKDRFGDGDDMRYREGEQEAGADLGGGDDKKPVFFSPAMRAVEMIKQEKGTGEQFLKMIEKNGGLKKEEDKWIGLSDFLKSKKNVTKQEVMDFIRENQLEVKEVHYSDQVEDISEGKEYDEWLDKQWERFSNSDEFYDWVVDVMDKEAHKYANARIDEAKAAGEDEGADYDKMYDDFYEEYMEDDLYGSYREAAERQVREEWEDGKEDAWEEHIASLTGGKAATKEDPAGMNETRTLYVTKGLISHKDVALVVPSVESYEGSFPEVHFTDAYTKGKAVAWVRYGDAWMPGEGTEATKQAEEAFYAYADELAKKYGGNGDLEEIVDKLTEEEKDRIQSLRKVWKDSRASDSKNKKRVLFVDEVQSQRHQDAREVVGEDAEGKPIRRGYKDPAANEAEAKRIEEMKVKLEELTKVRNAALDKFADFDKDMMEKYGSDWQEKMNEDDRAELAQVKDSYTRAFHEHRELTKEIEAAEVRLQKAERDGVPDAPFRSNWSELAMKRMLRMAAEEGYDKLVWTDGTTQTMRYNLGGQVDWIQRGNDSGSRNDIVFVSIGGKVRDIDIDENGKVIDGYHIFSSAFGHPLSDVLGKELAEKVLSATPGKEGRIQGEGLMIGGEGMQSFYDEMLPSWAKKYGKKWGVEVKKDFVPGVSDEHSGHKVWKDGNSGLEVWSMDITPEMKESVMEGQAMWREGDKVAGAGAPKKGGKKELLGVHNISEDKLRNAIKGGGLANPSAAVINVNTQDHDNFGSISLLMDPSLVEAGTGRNAGTWTGDVWTPMYPKVYSPLTLDGMKAMQDYMEKLGVEPKLARWIYDNSEAPLREGRFPSMSYLYLKEKGIDTTEYRRGKVSVDWRRLFERFKTLKSVLKATEADKVVKDGVVDVNVKEALNKAVNDYVISKLQESNEDWKDLNIDVWREMKKEMKAKYQDDNGNWTPEIIKEAYNAMKKNWDHIFGADYLGTEYRAWRMIDEKGWGDDYRKWVNDKIHEWGVEEKLDNGRNKYGYQEWLPNNAENASHLMNMEQKLVGNGSGGWGSFAGEFFDRMYTLDDMRANKDKLSAVDDNEPIRDEMSELCIMLKNKSSLLGLWDGTAAVALAKACKEKDPVKYLEKKYRIELDSEEADAVREFADAANNMKQKYFETKFQRVVQLREFAGAVVPKGTSDDVIQAIKDAGLTIYEYNPKRKGNRASVVKAASKELELRFREGDQEAGADLGGEEGVDPNVAPQKKDAIKGVGTPGREKSNEELADEMVRDIYGDPSTWTGYMKAIREKDVAEKKENLLEQFAEEDAVFEARKEAVTSDAFRKWFGDWMEDPKNASKVVDMKGRPLMLWHGTSKGKYGFTTFDTRLDIEGRDGYLSNIGSHFGNEQQAKDVNGGQDKFYQVYLNIRNPYSTWDWFAGLDHELVSAALELAHEIGTPEAMEELKNMEKAWPWIKDFYDADMADDEIMEAVEEAASGPYVKGGDKVFYDVMRNLLKMGGYDGIRYDNFYDGGGESWVALDPNQIKSAEVDGAMKNNGEFSSESGDIRERWIGEKGAGALDTYNGNTDILDQLKIAKEEEKKGVKARTIKLGTGWERGADGKWRYEQRGIHLKQLHWDSPFMGKVTIPMSCKVGDLVDDPTLFEEYPELRNFDFQSWMSDLDKAGGAIGSFNSGSRKIKADMEDYRQQMAKIQNQKNMQVFCNQVLSLEDDAFAKKVGCMNDPEVIAKKRKEIEDESSKIAERLNSMETLIMAELEGLENTINHEIQHYIQYVEGFARGSNPTSAYIDVSNARDVLKQDEDYNQAVINDYMELEDLKGGLEFCKISSVELFRKQDTTGVFKTMTDEELEDARNDFNCDRYFAVMDQLENLAYKYRKNLADYGINIDELHAFFEQQYDAGAKPADIAKQGKYLDEAMAFMEDVCADAKKKAEGVEGDVAELNRLNEILNSKTPTQMYLAFAGEVEARNAELRKNLPDAVRRGTLASDTEKIPRKDQIIISGGSSRPGAEFTIKRNDEILEQSEKKNEETGRVNREDMDEAKKGITGVVDMMRPYAKILPPDVEGSNLFGNHSYGLSVENTTICVRTLAYNAFVNEVQKKLGRPLSQRESFLASQKLYDIAVDPQCLYCYVSLDRKAFNDMILKYMRERDEAIAKYKEAGMPSDYKALFDEFLKGRKPTKNMKARYKMFTQLAKGDPADMITLEELATEESKIALANSPKANQYLDIKAYAQSASQAKLQVDYAAYGGDILELKQSDVDALNSEYGLRFYSFSDYSGAFIAENMQQLLDASVMGFKGLAYTKDPNFARIFAPTGININISVFAKSDGKGGYYIDERQSAKLQESIDLRDKYDNVGIVVVATDDDGVKWACKQKWSDVVIPFHIVRTGADIAEFYKWTKYNSQQNDVYANDVEVPGKKGKMIKKRAGSKAPQITPVEHENNYEKYMELCRERGLVPRFERLRLAGDLTGEEWFKMVKETRKGAQDTPYLRPKFDYEAAKVAFQEFVDKGGYYEGWYLPGVDVDAEIDEVVSDVRAGKTAADVSYGRQDWKDLTEEDMDEIVNTQRKTNRKHQEDVERAKKIEQEIFEAKVAGKKVGAEADPNMAPKQAAEGDGSPADTGRPGGEAPGTEAAGTGKGGADLGAGDVRERDGEEEMGAGGADLGSETGGAEEQAGEWGLDRFGKLRWKENVVIDPSTEMVDYRKNRKKKSRSMGARAQELMDEGAFDWQDHVEMVLAGGMKFRGDDKTDENGGVTSKGILSHTGLKRKDIGAWVASKNDENAMTPEVVAEKIYEEMPEGLKEGVDVQDVFNHILEVVTGYDRQRILLDAVEKRHLAAEVEGLEEYEAQQKDIYAQQHGYATWRDFEEAEGWMELQEQIRKEREERMSKILRDKYLRRLGYDGEADYMRQVRNLDKRARKAAMKRRIQELREEILAALDDAERVTNRPPMPERKKGESVFDYAERVSQAQKAQADWDREHMVESMTTQEAQKRIVNLIKDQLDRDSVSAMDKRTLNSILNTLQQTDVNNLPERIEEAKKLVNRIKVRANENDIKRFLDLKVADVNGKNMSIAKNVDDDTRKIMEMVKGTIADTQDSGLEDRIHDLRSANWHAREEIRTMDMEDPDYDAKVDDLRKKIDENNTEITSLIQQRSIIINEKVKKGDVSVDAEIARVEKRMEEAAEAGKEYDQNDVNEMTALQVQKFMLDNAQIDRDIIEMENKHAVVKVAKRRLYDHYKDQLSAAKVAVDAEPSHENVEVWKQLSAEYRKQMSRLESMEDGLNRLINEGQVQKAENQERLRDMLSEIVTGGKDSLKTKIENMQKRRLDILRGTIEDIRPDDRNDNAKIGDKENEERAGEHWSKALFTRALSSFEYMAQTIAENSLGKDSYFYKRFVLGQEGVQAAINEYTDSMRRSRERLDEKVKQVYKGKIKTFGDWWKEMDSKPKYGAWGKKHGIRINNAWATTGITILDMDKLDEHGNPTGERYEITDMSKGQATYMYMLWKMADGRAKLEMMGFDEESMEEVADYIGYRNMDMADWFQDELFAEERERVNERYKEIYNTSMAAIENYVPIKINGGAIREDVDLSGDSGQGAGKLVVKTGALVNRTINDKPIDTNWSAAKVVWDHLEQVEDFYAFAPVRRDLGWVLSNQYVRNQLNKNSAGSYKRLLAAAEVAVRAKVNQGDRTMDKIYSTIQKGLVGGNIAFRNTTAMKQMLSVPAFFGYSQDPRYTAALMWNIAKIYGSNSPMLVANMASFGTLGQRIFENTAKTKEATRLALTEDVKWVMNNLPDFWDRVTKGTAGDNMLDAEGIGGWFGRFQDGYMKLGMRTNQMVDALTCAIGVKTIYDYKMARTKDRVNEEAKRMIAEGTAEDVVKDWKKQQLEDAHKQALMEATIYYNGTQQSNNTMFLAPQQVSKGFVDRAVSLYQNASIGYARKFVTSVQDLYRLRHWDGQLSKYLERELKDMGYTKEEPAPEKVRKEAEAIVRKRLWNEARKKAFDAVLYGYVMNKLWDLGGEGFLGMFTDDPGILDVIFGDAKVKDLLFTNKDMTDMTDKSTGERIWSEIQEFSTMPARGTTGMNLISGILSGTRPEIGLSAAEIQKFFDNATKAVEEDGVFSPELMYVVFERAARFAGVSMDMVTNTYMGAERMAQDLPRFAAQVLGVDANGQEVKRQDLLIDLMFLMSSPESNRAQVAKKVYMEKWAEIYGGDKRDHMEEISERWMDDVTAALKYTQEDDVFESWLPSTKVLRDAQKDKLEKEFMWRMMTDKEKEIKKKWDKWEKELNACEDLDSCMKMYKGETDEYKKEKIRTKMQSLAKEDDSDTMQQKLNDFLGKGESKKQEYEKMYIQYSNEEDALEDTRLQQKLRDAKKVYDKWDKMDKAEDPGADKFYRDNQDAIEYYQDLYDAVREVREEKMRLEDGDDPQEVMGAVRKARREALRM